MDLFGMEWWTASVFSVEEDLRSLPRVEEGREMVFWMSNGCWNPSFLESGHMGKAQAMYIRSKVLGPYCKQISRLQKKKKMLSQTQMTIKCKTLAISLVIHEIQIKIIFSFYQIDKE